MQPQDRGPVGRDDSTEDVKLDLIAEAVSPELRPLLSAMAANPRLDSEDQLTLLRQVLGVKAGSAWNGYTMAKLEGKSRADARAHPATAALLAITDYLGADGATADVYRRAYD
jgi:hypothetical protein